MKKHSRILVALQRCSGGRDCSPVLRRSDGIGHGTVTGRDITVRYADLDAGTVDGATLLLKRIEAASGRVCASLDHGDLASRSRREACERKLTAAAVTRVNSPVLAECVPVRASRVAARHRAGPVASGSLPVARWVRVTPQRFPGADLGLKRQAGMRGTGGGHSQAGNLLQRLRQHRQHMTTVQRLGSGAIEGNLPDVPCRREKTARNHSRRLKRRRCRHRGWWSGGIARPHPRWRCPVRARRVSGRRRAGERGTDHTASMTAQKALRGCA